MEYVEIDKIINVELGKTPSRNNSDYWNGKHTWIAISDMNKKYIVNSKEKITNEAIENTKIKKVPKDTVIMSFKLSIGKRAITKSEVYTNEAIAAFHIKDLKYLIPEYLYYALESVDFLKYTDKAVKGKTLNKEKLKKIKIPILPLTEQLKISEILNKTQKIIEDKKKQIFLFDELIKSRFIEMFGDPIRNDKGWEISNFEKNFEISSGGTPSTKIMEYWENGDISWIGSNLCQNKILHENDGKYITELGYENSSAKLYEKGTILIALVGATIGKAALLKFSTATNQNIAGVEVDNNKFSSDFVFFVVQLLYPKFQGISKNKFKMANLKFIKDLPIIIPPLYLQEEFSQFVEKTDKFKV